MKIEVRGMGYSVHIDVMKIISEKIRLRINYREKMIKKEPNRTHVHQKAIDELIELHGLLVSNEAELMYP